MHPKIGRLFEDTIHIKNIIRMNMPLNQGCLKLHSLDTDDRHQFNYLDIFRKCIRFCTITDYNQFLSLNKFEFNLREI